jgi:hypothetical protein
LRRTTQHFTTLGRFGVACALIGPAILAIALRAIPPGGLMVASLPHVALIALSAAASIASLPMLLIGREYRTRD